MNHADFEELYKEMERVHKYWKRQYFKKAPLSYIWNSIKIWFKTPMWRFRTKKEQWARKIIFGERRMIRKD